MCIVTFKLRGKPENRLEITQSLKGIADEVKEDKGCIDTILCQDINDENTFLLIEEWQKKRRFEDHMKSRLYAALLGINGLLVKPPEIKIMVEN